MSGSGEAAVPRDIYAEDRRRIAERDWGRIHLQGDRNPPIPNLTRRDRGAWQDA